MWAASSCRMHSSSLGIGYPRFFIFICVCFASEYIPLTSLSCQSTESRQSPPRPRWQQASEQQCLFHPANQDSPELPDISLISIKVWLTTSYMIDVAIKPTGHYYISQHHCKGKWQMHSSKRAQRMCLFKRQTPMKKCSVGHTQHKPRLCPFTSVFDKFLKCLLHREQQSTL